MTIRQIQSRIYPLSCDVLAKKFRRFYCLVFGLKILFLASQKIHRIVAFDDPQHRSTKLGGVNPCSHIA
jgi:hypothetical protein